MIKNAEQNNQTVFSVSNAIPVREERYSPITRVSKTDQNESKLTNLLRALTNCDKSITSNLEQIFAFCEQYPDYIVQEYQRKYPNSNQFDNNIHSEDDCIMGDPKYHYLMVDASTSITIIKPIIESTDTFEDTTNLEQDLCVKVSNTTILIEEADTTSTAPSILTLEFSITANDETEETRRSFSFENLETTNNMQLSQKPVSI